MADETEVIRHQMEQTRESLTDKLEKLEDKVVNTVQSTTDTVAETVSSVREAVQGTVDAVQGTVQETVETVKQTFDLRRQVHNHPWLMFGGAVATGFVGGLLLPPATRAARNLVRRQTTHVPPYTPEPSRYQAASEGRPSSGGGSWLGGLTDQLAPVLNKVKGLAVGAATGLMGEMIVKAVPESLKGQVNEVVNELTGALGGTPVHGLLDEPEKQPQQA